MNRRKLTKKERSLLWYDAKAKCQICGNELEGDGWHADHIIPFIISGKTNIHELQVLCPQCNLEKGVAMLRQHQIKMLEVCDEILAGRQVKEIICDITPGGGKSALPLILAHKLIPKRFDKICWVVPRTSLREQGEEAFIDEYFRRPYIIGHNCLIRQSTGDRDPSRNLQGHITTYQAIAQNAWTLQQEFERYNYILFLDENHHVATDSPFERALLPLVHRAGLVVYASGTLERGDNLPIAFLTYKQTEMGLIVDLAETEARQVIRYPRRIALDEKAILPLEFEVSDSKAEWVDRDGNTQSIDSFYGQDVDLRSAISTVLKTSFAFQLIDKCIDHWRGYKTHTYSQALLLVVAPTIEVGKDYLDYLKERGLKCAMVHSKEDDRETQSKIKRFKRGLLDALVTVAIAYEGLDVPEITHIACLTHYRSKPWLEQCFARANRTRGRKERAFIFAPDDPDFNRVMENLRLEQLSVVRQIDKDPDNLTNSEPDNPPNPQNLGIIPQGSQMTDTRAIAPNLNETVNPEQYRVIENAREKAGLPNGLSITQLNRFLLEAGFFSLQNGNREPNINVPLVTPTQQQDNLLHSIETYTRKVDKEHFGMAWGSTNKEIYSVFQKNRRDMTIEELQEVWRFLQSAYPLEFIQ